MTKSKKYRGYPYGALFGVISGKIPSQPLGEPKSIILPPRGSPGHIRAQPGPRALIIKEKIISYGGGQGRVAPTSLIAQGALRGLGGEREKGAPLGGPRFLCPSQPSPGPLRSYIKVFNHTRIKGIRGFRPRYSCYSDILVLLILK